MFTDTLSNDNDYEHIYGNVICISFTNLNTL